jgi:hypothetical protein
MRHSTNSNATEKKELNAEITEFTEKKGKTIGDRG